MGPQSNRPTVILAILHTYRESANGSNYPYFAKVIKQEMITPIDNPVLAPVIVNALTCAQHCLRLEGDASSRFHRDASALMRNWNGAIFALETSIGGWVGDLRLRQKG